MIAIFEQIIACLFLLAGTGLYLISIVGVRRWPDFMQKIHASSIGELLAPIAVLTGVLLLQSTWVVKVKLLLVILVLLLTNAAAGYNLANYHLKLTKKKKDHDAE